MSKYCLNIPKTPANVREQNACSCCSGLAVLHSNFIIIKFNFIHIFQRMNSVNYMV